MDSLSQFRAEIDQFFGRHHQSPLSSEQKRAIKGLPYYEANPAFVFSVVAVLIDEDEPLIQMETSTGDTRFYRRWGRITFPIEGDEASLTIYTDPDGEDFFVPFKDATNGKTTYGAGRYLDNHRPGLQQLSDTQFEIDFNFAYNPYCAYSDLFSCPLPPRENWLTVAIAAGERKWEKE